MQLFGVSHRQLGIVVSERSLLLAEASGGQGPLEVTRTAEFRISPGVSLQQPEQLGVLLAAFLREHGFTAQGVVWGVPAKWLIVRPHTLPPTDLDTASSILRLHASTQVSSELGEVVFDYSGDISPVDSKLVLLIGLQRRWLDRLAALAASAQLKMLAVTPIAAALADSTSNGVEQGGPRLIVSMRADAAELIAAEAGRILLLRHLGSPAGMRPLLAELRRSATAAHLRADDARGSGRPNEILLWDDIGLESTSLNALGDAGGVKIVPANPVWQQGATGAASGHSPIALTLASRSGRRPTIDFLRPRIRPPALERLRWRTAGPVVAVAISMLSIIMAFDASRVRARASRIDAALQNMKPALEVATPFVAGNRFVESYRSTPPRYLACMRDITLALPASGKAYLVNFTLHANMKGEFAGHSASEQDVLNLADNLRSSGRFGDVACKLEGGNVRGGGESSFFVTFTYVHPT